MSLLGAQQNNVLPSLLQELSLSQPATLGKINFAAQSLPTKSYRWVKEMQEIGEYYTEAGYPEGGEMFEGIAKLFERTDREKEGDGSAGEVLNKAAELARGLMKEGEK